MEWLTQTFLSFSLHASPVFDPVTGFGGDGVTGTYSLPTGVNFTSNLIFPELFKGCVLDGPFKDYTLHFGPGKLITDHCLVRGINDSFAIHLNSVTIANTTRLPTFEQFRIELEGQPITPTPKLHDSGHLGTGGDMSNFYSSPGGKLSIGALLTR